MPRSAADSRLVIISCDGGGSVHDAQLTDRDPGGHGDRGQNANAATRCRAVPRLCRLCTFGDPGRGPVHATIPEVPRAATGHRASGPATPSAKITEIASLDMALG